MSIYTILKNLFESKKEIDSLKDKIKRLEGEIKETERKKSLYDRGFDIEKIEIAKKLFIVNHYCFNKKDEHGLLFKDWLIDEIIRSPSEIIDYFFGINYFGSFNKIHISFDGIPYFIKFVSISRNHRNHTLSAFRDNKEITEKEKEAIVYYIYHYEEIEGIKK